MCTCERGPAYDIRWSLEMITNRSELNSDRFHAYVREPGDDFDRENERSSCPFPSLYRTAIMQVFTSEGPTTRGEPV
jgi:hypothetical protein